MFKLRIEFNVFTSQMSNLPLLYLNFKLNLALHAHDVKVYIAEISSVEGSN